MTDNMARWIICCGLIVTFPIGFYFRLRSHTDEKLDRKQEGWPVLITLRPFALAAVVGLILYLINPTWMAWASVPLPSLLRWIGVPFGVAAILLIFWTFSNLGHNLTDTVVTRRDAQLVTSGPYQYVRHPFYVAFALAMVGNALVTANAFIAIASFASFCAIVARTPIEEAKLLEAFGDDYRSYMARTGRFIPRAGPSAGNRTSP